jgi:hypothetical protein
MTHPKDLSALWREREAAYAAVNSALEPEDDPAWQRYSAVDAAIRAARPMTLSGIAVQARLLQDSITHGTIDQTPISPARSPNSWSSWPNRRPPDRLGG